MDAQRKSSFVKPGSTSVATGSPSHLPAHDDKQRAIGALSASLDVAFFKAISEPVRQEIIFILLQQGRSNVQQVAQHMVQDRSVISRHLAFLEQAGFLRSARVQRYTVYELDGPAIIRRLEDILQQLRAAARVCCPPPVGTDALVAPLGISLPD